MDVLSPPDSLDLLLKALKSKKFTSLDVSYTKVSAAGFMISSFLLGLSDENLSLFPPIFLISRHEVSSAHVWMSSFDPCLAL